MLFVAIGYNEINKADPDCGTTFTWATRTFGPTHRLAGRVGHHRLRRPRHGQPGPGRRAVRVPALQRQRHRPRTPRAAGCCWWGSLHRGHDLDLLPGHRGLRQVPEDPVLDRGRHAGGLRRRGHGAGRHRPAPPRTSTPGWSWFNPAAIKSLGARNGLLLMLFIYWGWDTSLSVNEETNDKERRRAWPASSPRSSCWPSTSSSPWPRSPSPASAPRGSAWPTRTTHRRLLRARHLGLRLDRSRTRLLPPADPDGAELGRRLHPDDHPPHRPDRPVDGGLQVGPQRLRTIHTEIHHPHGGDREMGAISVGDVRQP